MAFRHLQSRRLASKPGKSRKKTGSTRSSSRAAGKKPAASGKRKGKTAAAKRRQQERRRFWRRQFLIALAIIGTGFTAAVLSVVYYPVDSAVVDTGSPEVPDPRQQPTRPIDPAPSPAAPESPTAPVSPRRAPAAPDPEHTEYPDAPAEDAPALPLLPEDKPWLVFVIDDAGYSMKQLERFLDTPAPMTIAVMPHLAYSKASAAASAAAGKEVILHMPMEAMNPDVDPGPGAIYTADDHKGIADRTAAAFRSVPHAVGANNHMGSRVTADKQAIGAFLDAMQAQDSSMLFLDSRTTAQSVAANAARARGVPVVERDIFLDNEDTRTAIMQAIEESKGVARRRGYAVMIGHVWSDELGEIISELYPELMEEGFHFGTLSELIAHLAEENR
ncbi:divergent polysaccharide deacetylase family protein [Spirochaeta africana]|uniref:Divergent polysaccharide deacetylase n=1 Tax=Spirochaeta africana (strain ATCC 700263 / DSM 8902 / Z-7692) TaxID=889378 RepID=H9UKB1_SPIAZ|nr:divergent polysaccharide deacetylase family protein [Spirochaeta africana]AFG37954.1 hypothetical protein Spiaf_1901 [Spirochaeta africana DSM 8902]